MHVCVMDGFIRAFCGRLLRIRPASRTLDFPVSRHCAVRGRPRAAPTGTPMIKLVSVCLLVLATPLFAQSKSDLARWQRESKSVTITRDDWGIAHIHGKTDADAVFGMIYAQAEDDFNRVEHNYLLSLGRLAEADGEGEIYRDLRMKLYIQ